MWLETVTRVPDVGQGIRVGLPEEKTFEQKHEESAKTRVSPVRQQTAHMWDTKVPGNLKMSAF